MLVLKLYSIFQIFNLFIDLALYFILHFIHLILNDWGAVLDGFIDWILKLWLWELKILALLIDWRQILFTIENKRFWRATANPLILRVKELRLVLISEILDILLVLAPIIRVKGSQSSFCHSTFVPKIEDIIATNVDRVNRALLYKLLGLSSSIFLPTLLLFFGFPGCFFLSFLSLSHEIQSSKSPIFVLVFKFFQISLLTLFKLFPFTLKLPFNGLFLS